MPNIEVLCRVATTFNQAEELDEEALREYFQRFVDAKIGIYIASGGSGEGHALTWEELRRTYEIGVAVGKGKIQVNSNHPEQHTAKKTREHLQLAIDCGIDILNLYGPSASHGFKPHDEEYMEFHSDVLSEIKHPIALSPHPTMGYSPNPALVAQLCDKYHQIVAVNLVGQGDMYLINLLDRLKRTDVAFNVATTSSINCFKLGATAIIGNEFNIIPKTGWSYIDSYQAGKFDEMNQAYVHIKHLGEYTAKWRARWIKMAMRILKLPGGNGAMRKPYILPHEDEIARFQDGLLRLRIPEIDNLARIAGLL